MIIYVHILVVIQINVTQSDFKIIDIIPHVINSIEVRLHHIDHNDDWHIEHILSLTSIIFLYLKK